MTRATFRSLLLEKMAAAGSGPVYNGTLVVTDGFP